MFYGHGLDVSIIRCSHQTQLNLVIIKAFRQHMPAAPRRYLIIVVVPVHSVVVVVTLGNAKTSMA